MKVIALTLAGVLFVAAAEAGRVTVEDLMRLRTISDVRISPDGRRVAYVVSAASYEQDAYEAVLYVVPSAGGAPVRLTYGTRIFNRPLPSPQLRWSPDGSHLSFLGLAGDRPQVFVMGADGGEARAVTAAPEGVIAYEWAPDGRRLAYVAADPPPADEERRRQEKSFVIQVHRPDRPVRLWVQDAGGGAAQALTPADQFVAGLDWSPDGSRLVYAASSRTGFMAPYDTRLYAVAPSGGAPRVLVDRPGMNTSPRFSPDGRWIAFVSTGGRAEFLASRGLHLVAADGGAAGSIRALTREVWIGDFVWAADSRAILFVAHENTAGSGARMFEQPILRIRLDAREPEILTAGPAVSYRPTLSRDGARLAYRSVGPRDMGDVFVMDLAARRAVRLTEVNPELRRLELGELRPIGWSSFDGMEIWGLLLTPPGYRGGERLPLVVYCHGGPIGGFTYGLFPQFMHAVGQVDPYPAEAMAAAGMAVLFPMPRGGSGYGEAGFRAIVNAWGEADYRDIMAGVDALVARGVADPDRLGVMGASYGGFMTTWIVTQTSRFRAASAGAAVTDLADLYYLSDGGDVMVEYFGLPWEARESYLAHSPLTHAARVTTPLLIQHGENDRRVPIAQAWKFYRALRAYGKIVEFDIYPR
ncbi:MAG TPA: S9 family peptidase, partial [Vicinamibacterales bacterium]|nr:S9 family peptidase [Vicinamibacterales bacterium]